MPSVIGPLLKTLLFTILVPETFWWAYPTSTRWIPHARTQPSGLVRPVSSRHGSSHLFPLRMGVRCARTGHARAHRSHEIPRRQRTAPLRVQSHVHWRVARNPRRSYSVSFSCTGGVGGFFLRASSRLRDFYEEPTLRRQFGDSDEEYRRSVPRWIPRSRK